MSGNKHWPRIIVFVRALPHPISAIFQGSGGRRLFHVTRAFDNIALVTQKAERSFHQAKASADDLGKLSFVALNL